MTTINALVKQYRAAETKEFSAVGTRVSIIRELITTHGLKNKAVAETLSIVPGAVSHAVACANLATALSVEPVRANADVLGVLMSACTGAIKSAALKPENWSDSAKSLNESRGDSPVTVEFAKQFVQSLKSKPGASSGTRAPRIAAEKDTSSADAPSASASVKPATADDALKVIRAAINTADEAQLRAIANALPGLTQLVAERRKTLMRKVA